MKGRYPPDESPAAARSSAHPQPKIARAYVFAAHDIDEREGLPGCVIVQYRRCGKVNCRCANPGAPAHGPYFYHYWREGGRARKRYVARDDAPRVAALCTRYRVQHPSLRELVRMLRTMDGMLARLAEKEGEGSR